MSLLLDALKRAEEAKRARQAAESGVAPPAAAPASTMRELRLEEEPAGSPRAATPAPAPAAAVPARDLALEPVEQAPPPLVAKIATSQKAASAATTARDARDTRGDGAAAREAARNVFAAKQAVGGEESNRPGWMLPVIAIAVTAVAAGGWYVWKEVSRAGRPMSPLGPRPPAPAAPVAPAAAGIAVVPAPTGTAAAAASDVPPLLPGKDPSPAAPVAAASVTPSATDAGRTAAPRPAEPPLALTPTRGTALQPPPADLEAAYAALRKGELERSAALYRRVLAADANNVDALLGAATIAARRGDAAAAGRLFRDVLAQDPRNGTALAGIVAVGGNAGPALEQDLKVLVGRYPADAALHFTLANVLAGQQRWTEAQQAYFQAHVLAPASADIVFNLAVSLDRINQPRLAREHYLKAVELAALSGAQFDPALASRRAAELADAR